MSFRYLSYGGGVNSTALLLFMLDRPEEFPPFESVFVDHGGDYPETYAYLELIQAWLAERGHSAITVLKTSIKDGLRSLYEHAWAENMIPVRSHRWCTDKFKVRPLHRYQALPRTVYMGIHAGEERRAVPATIAGETKVYPLVEYGIDQAGCERIIRDHGLPVPPKSGCYFCPFARVQQVRDLAKRDDGLFCKVKALEDRNVQGRIDRGKKPIYLYGVPLEQVIDPSYRPGQEALWEEARPCSCGL